MMKICPQCDNGFEPTREKQVWCKPCRRIYDRNYYKNQSQDAKAKMIDRVMERSIENKQFIWDYLLEHPCVECGEDDPIVLEFDHIDRLTKTHNISEMSKWARSRIEEEIEKCRVLCCNCHRRHTAAQMGWYAYLTG